MGSSKLASTCFRPATAHFVGLKTPWSIVFGSAPSSPRPDLARSGFLDFGMLFPLPFRITCCPRQTPSCLSFAAFCWLRLTVRVLSFVQVQGSVGSACSRTARVTNMAIRSWRWPAGASSSPTPAQPWPAAKFQVFCSRPLVLRSWL